MQTLKIVVVGPARAGKTQFIQSVSEIEVVNTERRISDQSTVALDFGRITVDDDLLLYLFGTPGQKRFDFMWEILSEGMLGFVVLVDSAQPESFAEAKRILSVFRSYSDTPYVIAANKQDLADAWTPADLRLALGAEPHIKIIPCVSTNKASVKQVLLELLATVQETLPADAS